MKLIVKKNYKSLTPFESDELGVFNVLIGKNGSGKSQLIELIQKKSENNFEFINIIPDFNRIQLEGLLATNIYSLTDDFWLGHVNQYFNYYSGLGKEVKAFFNDLINLGLTKKDLEGIDNDYTLLSDFFTKVNTSIGGERFNIILIEMSGKEGSTFPISLQAKNVLNYLIVNIPKSFIEVTSFIVNYKRKYFSELEHIDFVNTPIPEKYFDNNDLIQSNLSQIFYSFLKRRYINELQYFNKQVRKDNNEAISFEEFDSAYRAPWDILNEIFSKAGLNYKFKEISAKEFSPDVRVSFDLIKKSTNQKIDYQFLSSGEKILIGLVIKLFTKSYYEGNLKFPDLIVLDEPDSHLHPEMSKQMIEILNDTFANELNIHVLITTHSPSTVALSPSDNIYIISNEPGCSLKKISKDDALNLLTENLPHLSVNYKNHRQVFVESPTDLEYYQTIFNLLRSKNKYNHELYFISNGYGKGNCNQVKEIISKLRESGNSTCYGIIDWDHKNEDEDCIYVHGCQSRYNLEAFLFDPAIVAVLFLELQYGDLKNYLKIDNNYNPYKLVYDQTLLQEGIDFIWDAFITKYPSLCKVDESKIEKEYYKSEFKINCPVWFFSQKGHGLKEKYMQTFPVLQSLVKKGEYALEQKLIETIARLYPFIPIETVRLIKELASN